MEALICSFMPLVYNWGIVIFTNPASPKWLQWGPGGHFFIAAALRFISWRVMAGIDMSLVNLDDADGVGGDDVAGVRKASGCDPLPTFFPLSSVCRREERKLSSLHPPRLSAAEQKLLLHEDRQNKQERCGGLTGWLRCAGT